MLIRSIIAIVTVAAWPAAANACSKVPVPGPFKGTVHFIGTAGADTLPAALGPVRPVPPAPERGHFGPTREGPLHGQIVRVHQLAASADPVLRRALARGNGDVLLVPWDYVADCRPVRWSRSARWVTPGTRGFYWAILRDSAHWSGGLPTLDVHAPQFVPYPGASGFERDVRLRRRRDSTFTMLTADELFALYDIFPEPRAYDDSTPRDPYAAVEPVLQWSRANPHLAERYPARDLISRLLSAAEWERVRAIRSAVAGTWRFRISLPSGDSLVLMARTTERPIRTLESITRDRPPRSATSIPRAAGYGLLAHVALDSASLPREGQRSRDTGVQGYLMVVEKPSNEGGDSTVWLGDADLLRAAANLALDEQLREQLRSVTRTEFEMYRSSELTFAPGRFVRDRAGQLRYEEMIVRGGVPVVRITGERVSRVHLSP